MGQETDGKVEQLKGKAKEVAGILTGNKALENTGARQRVAGTVQSKVGKTRRRVADALADAAAKMKK